MDNPRWRGREVDELTGSPELFATNLVVVEAIEKQLAELTLRKQAEGVFVTMTPRKGENYTEKLTDDVTRWDAITERFRNMTDFHRADRGQLDPRAPAARKTESIGISFDDDRICLRFTYACGD